METFLSSLIISVVYLVGGVAENELSENLDGMWHDETCSDGLTIKRLALGGDLT